MKGKILRIAGAALIVAVLLLAVALPVLAVDLPDSNPKVTQFNLYRNVLETGDILLLIYANIPYATPPSEPIWQTYMWRLYEADNVTELAVALPYSFNDNGYGYNLVSMYLDAATVSGNITWGGGLPVRLSGNPTAFDDPPQYNYTIQSGDYSTLTDTSDVRVEIGARILVLATELNAHWGLATAYSLLSETETGTVLSIYGEAFFRGAIYGLQGMCPQIFSYVVSDLDLTPRTWDTTYIATLRDQFDGTWVDTAKAGLDTLFGTTYSLAWLLVSAAVCLFVFLIGNYLYNDAWLGWMDASLVAVIAVRLGFIDLGFAGLMAAVAVVYDSARLWGVFK